MKEFLGCVGLPGAVFLGYVGGLVVGVSIGGRTIRGMKAGPSWVG
jgi:hypothetical protein